MKRSSSHHSTSCCFPTKPTKAIKETKDNDIPSDTEAALSYLCKLYSSSHIGGPPIVLKHQIYSLINNKTTVDRDIISLRDNHKIRLFKLESGQEDYAVLLFEDYCSLVSNKLGDTPLQRKVVSSLLQDCVDVSISKTKLIKDFKLSEDDISILVNHGILLLRDVSGPMKTWWFSIPGISSFKREFIKDQEIHHIPHHHYQSYEGNTITTSCHNTLGRTAVLQIFKRLKYNEILETELEKKKLSMTRLPMEYYMHDLLGAELVESIKTSSGQLLRLIE